MLTGYLKSSIRTAVVFALSAAISPSLGQTASQAPNASSEGIHCEAPKSPLFQAPDADEALDVQVMMDYAALSRKDGPKEVHGVIAAKNERGEFEFSPVVFQKRGNSRGMLCEAPPFKILFIEQGIQKSLDEKLRAEGMATNSEGYIKRYYQLFSNTPLSEEIRLNAKGTGIFSKLGDDLKVVTHCGKTTIDGFGAPTVEEQNTKLVSEFYIYKLLSQFNSLLEAARLANIKYLDPQGQPVESRPGFFREPRSSLAKRCGLLSKKPAQAGTDSDKLSAFQTEFMNYFIANSDFGFPDHNIEQLWDATGKSYFAPYDFDLSAILAKSPSAVTYRLTDFSKYLKSKDPKMVSMMSKRTLALRIDFERTIKGMNLSDEWKERFRNWLNINMAELSQHASVGNN